MINQVTHLHADDPVQQQGRVNSIHSISKGTSSFRTASVCNTYARTHRRNPGCGLQRTRLGSRLGAARGLFQERWCHRVPCHPPHAVAGSPLNPVLVLVPVYFSRERKWEREIFYYIVLMVLTGGTFSTGYEVLFFILSHLTYSRWTSSLPSCLWSQRIFSSLPRSRLTFF